MRSVCCCSPNGRFLKWRASQAQPLSVAPAAMDYRQLLHQANALAVYSYSSAYNSAAANNARTYSYRLWTLANVLTNDPCAFS